MGVGGSECLPSNRRPFRVLPEGREERRRREGRGEERRGQERAVSCAGSFCLACRVLSLVNDSRARWKRWKVALLRGRMGTRTAHALHTHCTRDAHALHTRCLPRACPLAPQSSLPFNTPTVSSLSHSRRHCELAGSQSCVDLFVRSRGSTSDWLSGTISLSAISS